jgi:hypothetical protein
VARQQVAADHAPGAAVTIGINFLLVGVFIAEVTLKREAGPSNKITVTAGLRRLIQCKRAP